MFGKLFSTRSSSSSNNNPSASGSGSNSNNVVIGGSAGAVEVGEGNDTAVNPYARIESSSSSSGEEGGGIRDGDGKQSSNSNQLLPQHFSRMRRNQQPLSQQPQPQQTGSFSHSQAAATALQFDASTPSSLAVFSSQQQDDYLDDQYRPSSLQQQQQQHEQHYQQRLQFQQQQQDDDFMIPVEQEQLAHAWFARRRFQKLMWRGNNDNDNDKNNGQESHNRPIDVDTVDDFFPSSASSRRLRDDDTAAGGVSEAGMSMGSLTSDSTLVVSNARPKRHNTPQQQQQQKQEQQQKQQQQSTSTTIAVAVATAPSPTSSRDMMGDGIGSAADSDIYASSWPASLMYYARRFCNMRTWRGKIVLALSIIVVLGVVTTVASAVASQKGSSGNDNPAKSGLGLDAGTIYSLRPTMAPPNTNSPTRAPTPRHNEPIDSDTRPTGLYSANPVASVSAPTTVSPTSSPSLSPAVAFENIQLRLLQYPLMGAVDGDDFGSSTALARNGLVMVVGAPDATVDNTTKAGSVQVFVQNSVTQDWIPRGLPLTGRNNGDQLGSAVAINADGSIVAASEPTHDGAGDRAGNVRVYQYSASQDQYVPLGPEVAGTAAAAYFGVSVALSDSGTIMAVGAPYYSGVNSRRLHGQVRVYELVVTNIDTAIATASWVLLGNPMSGDGNFDWLGWDVALSSNGRVLVASAPRNTQLSGYCKSWFWQDGAENWVELGNNVMVNDQTPSAPSDFFGESISVTNTDSTYRVAIGIPFKNTGNTLRSGMTVVYELDLITQNWVLMDAPVTSVALFENDQAGFSVDLVEGNLLAVGVPGFNNETGAVYLYRFDDVYAVWEQHPDTWGGVAIGDDFGFAVGIAAKPLLNEMVLTVGALTANKGGAGYVATFQQIQRTDLEALTTSTGTRLNGSG